MQAVQSKTYLEKLKTGLVTSSSDLLLTKTDYQRIVSLSKKNEEDCTKCKGNSIDTVKNLTKIMSKYVDVSRYTFPELTAQFADNRVARWEDPTIDMIDVEVIGGADLIYLLDRKRTADKNGKYRLNWIPESHLQFLEIELVDGPIRIIGPSGEPHY